MYLKALSFAESEGVTRDMALHPVHMIPDKEGQLPPSALVPFCFYQGDDNMLGERRPELDNMTMCNKFQPTILDGQRCHSLDITKLEKKPAMTGKTNGLLLLLDPNPYPVNSGERSDATQGNEPESFKVYIHTLAQDTLYGSGTYAMSALKSMTSTEGFKQMPDQQKKCFVHNREKCQTDSFIDHVKSNCSCVPWPLATNNTNTKVHIT